MIVALAAADEVVAEMVKKHSLDERGKPTGGRLGVVPRRRLPPAIAAAVFNAQKGEVVGPFKTGRGYELLKVEEILLGQLRPKTAGAIRRVLFRRWLLEQVRTAKVEVKLTQHL